MVVALLLFLGTMSGAQVAPAAAPFWEQLGSGPYAVGFRVLYRRDPSRRWLAAAREPAKDPGRPIRVSVWYPAKACAPADRMRYGDYLHYAGPSDFQSLNQRLEKSDREGWLSDLKELTPAAESVFDKLLSLPVAACREAAPAPGRFPLLLFSGGKASRADANVELAEYLASHGYVVASLPQLGPSDQELDLGSSPQEIELRAGDYEAALVALRKLPDVDPSRIGAAGHSAGGEVAIDLALRDPDIRAVVGLDGSFGMSSGSRVLRRLAAYDARRHLSAALLDLRRGQGSQGVKLDLSAVDALRWTEEYRVTFAQGFHGDFTEWGVTGLKLGLPMPPNPDGHTREMGYAINQRVGHAVLDFLDATLRGDAQGRKRLEAEIAHFPEATLTHRGAATALHPGGQEPGPSSRPKADSRRPAGQKRACILPPGCGTITSCVILTT